MTDLKAKTDVLDKFAYIKFASAPETGLANYWNEVAESLTEIFKFTPEEIKKTRMDRQLMTALLREKMEKISSNDAEYRRVMKAVCEKINTLKDTVKADTIPSNYIEATDSTYDTAANALENITSGNGKVVNFENMSQHLTGPKAVRNGNVIHYENQSLKQIQKSFVEERFLGIKSTFEGLLNSMNFYRKVATNSIDTLKDRPREIKEEVIEFCKQLAIDRHMVDFETKFYALRNPYPNMDDFSDIEIKDGKVINKYVGAARPMADVDIPMDWDFFKTVMQTLYKEPLHPDTEAVFRDTNITGVGAYRDAVFKDIGDTKYFAKLQHFVENRGSDATSARKFLLLGMSPDDLFSKIGLRKYNSQTWRKTFGTIGAVLLGVTLVAQFFFGRMKLPENRQKG